MSSEYGELVGIDNLHYATVTDSVTAYTPGTNTYLAPAGDISIEGKSNIKPRYYDNKPYFLTTTEGESTATITVSGVPLSLAAVLTGKPYNSSIGVFIDTGDLGNAPWCAFSGRMDLGDGGYRYFQYLKGKFSYSKMEASSKKDNIDEKTAQLTYTAVMTEYQFTMPDSSTHVVKGVFADTTDAAFTAGDDWFDQVQTPATIGAPAALTLTSSPANNATGVLATVHPTLTFSNKIADTAVTLVKYSDNSIVTATQTWDSTGKILTITPASSLTASAVYLIVVSGVVDIYAQELATSIVKFTVAS